MIVDHLQLQLTVCFLVSVYKKYQCPNYCKVGHFHYVYFDSLMMGEGSMRIDKDKLGEKYKDNEVDKNATSAKIAQVQTEGKRTVKREVEYYNLDIILAVGYRANSKIAIEFRKWATTILKEHIVQGYTINQERLQKNYDEFLRVVEDIKVLSKNADNVRAEDVLEIIIHILYKLIVPHMVIVE